MAVYRDKKDGRWRFRARVVLPNGNRERISGTAPKDRNTKAGAQGAERDEIARVLNPAASSAAPTEMPTFKEWSEVYMERATADQSPSERDGKRQKLKSLLVPMFGGARIDTIGRLELDGLRALLKKRKRAASTINNYLSVVGAILSYAVECKKLSAAPELGLLDVPDQPFEFYSDSELAELLEAHKHDVMMTCALLLGCDAGLRAGEIRALHRVNVGNGKLIVMFSDYDGELKDPKGGRTRTVPLTPRLAAAIHAATHAHLGPRVLVRLSGHRDHLGCPWSKQWMVDRAPAKGWHALRHTFCSRLAARGVPVTQIQALAGHVDIRTTQRYMHHAPDVLATAVMVLDPTAEKKETPTVAAAGVSGQRLANYTDSNFQTVETTSVIQ